MTRSLLSVSAWRYVALAVAVSLAVATPWAPREARAQTEQSIVVLVNDEPVTSFDIAQRLRFFEISTRKEPTARDRENIVEELIVERIQLQEARKNGVTVPEEQVNEIHEDMAKRNNMTGEQLTQALGQMGVNVKTLRDRTRAGLAWRGLVRRKFQHQVNVGSIDVERALESDGGGGGVEKTEFELRRVQLEVSNSADQKTLVSRLTEAERLRNRFDGCGSIESLVKQVSRASVRDFGRKLADEMPQPARALLLAAEAGQMTPPNITSAGIEIYAVCAKRTVKAAGGEQQQAVRAKLVDEEFQRLARGYLGDLRASAFVEWPGKKE